MHTNLNPRHPREGIVERNTSHADLIFFPALESSWGEDLGL